MSIVSGTGLTTRIPFLDLQKDYQQLRADGLEDRILESLRRTSYIESSAVHAFEEHFAAYCQAAEGIALDSGTAALHLALLAADIGPGDEVLVPAHTFIATAAVVAMVGARPVFVDVDPQSWQMSAATVASAITSRTRVVIAVHLFGMPVDIEAIQSLCESRGLLLIEDAAQAHGARFRDRRIGSFGSMACFSFYPAKNLGAFGDGGAVVTSDHALAERIRRLRNHGRLTKYEHSEVGYNFRMDEIQGVVLDFKLPYLDKWNQRRRDIAAIYRKELASLPLSIPHPHPNSEQVYHLFPVAAEQRDSLAAFLADRQIDTGVHYPVPLHLQPAFAHLGGKAGDFPVAETIGQKELSLPIGPYMTDEQVDRVCAAVAAFFL